MSKKNFISVSFSVCTGISIFREIAVFSFFRTLSHFLVFLMLCSTLALTLRFSSIESAVHVFLKAFSDEFGAVLIGDSSFYPELAPEKARALVIGPCRIDYIPEGLAKNMLDISTSSTKYGAIWKPDSFLLWSRSGSELFNYLVMRDFGGYHGDGLSRGSAPQMEAAADAGKLSPAFFSALKAFGRGNVLNLMSLKAEIVATYCLAVFLNFLLVMAFLIPIFSFFSSFLYALSGPNLDVPSSFVNLSNMAFYSSFPGILIASVSYGFQLEILDFQTVALMSFICYYTYILGKLQKRENKEETVNYYDDF